MRTMALDIGDKRIGVAVSDETNTISTGVSVIARETLKRDIEKIKNYVDAYKVGKIIVGLPLTLKGGKSIQTEKVEGFISRLKQSVNISIVPFDERLSTAQSEKLLISADVSRKKRKTVIDKLAAQIILQAYLDMVS